jgi:enoyl-CoA hydratase/carnithine racemase
VACRLPSHSSFIVHLLPSVPFGVEARAVAENIAAKSPLAVCLSKHAMNTIEFMDLRDGYRFEQNMTHELTGSEDAKEAARAFVEKRKPVFTGC